MATAGCDHANVHALPHERVQWRRSCAHVCVFSRMCVSVRVCVREPVRACVRVYGQACAGSQIYG
eukprot:3116648-Pleurochrysis_carterae.AAC.2